MARFHNYSFGNIMLIARQKPQATNVAGIRTWNSLGRFVKRGEKGIMILAPMIGRKKADGVAESTETRRNLPPIFTGQPTSLGDGDEKSARFCMHCNCVRCRAGSSGRSSGSAKTTSACH